MSPRRRIWSELLPPEELGADATCRLLDQFAIEPIVALPPSRQTPAMAHALARLSEAGLRVGLWPLLDDKEGYWPSMGNADAFSRRVEDVLEFAERAGVRVQTVAIDLEPPLEITRALFEGPKWRALLRETRTALSPDGREERIRAAHTFEVLRRDLDRRGIETIAAVLPMIVFDLASGAGLWQGLFGTPVASAGWDVVSPMLYTSMISHALPTRRLQSARGILFETARLLALHSPRGSSVSLGLLAAGKLGTEPILPDPDALRLDVGAARAAGVDDLALFSLEGALHQAQPERWLEPFVSAPPVAPPRSPRNRLAGVGVRGLAAAMRSIRGGRMEERSVGRRPTETD